MIETLVVDLGGVAARFHPERRLEALARLTGLEPRLITARLFESGFEAAAETGAYSLDDIAARVIATLGHPVATADLVGAWSLAFEPDARVLALISGVAARRVILTNNGPMLDLCLAGDLRELWDSFEDVICSWHLRARKPDPEAFERTAERLRCAPGSLLLLDDSLANVEAAERCGWSAARVVSVEDVAATLASHRL